MANCKKMSVNSYRILSENLENKMGKILIELD
jgi:hypothetical protein